MRRTFPTDTTIIGRDFATRNFNESYAERRKMRNSVAAAYVIGTLTMATCVANMLGADMQPVSQMVEYIGNGGLPILAAASGYVATRMVQG